MEEQYKIDREVAYVAAGITKDVLAEALWEYVFGQQDSSKSTCDSIQAKRMEIKTLYPKPDISSRTD
jgi:hypothetical protein